MRARTYGAAALAAACLSPTGATAAVLAGPATDVASIGAFGAGEVDPLSSSLIAESLATAGSRISFDESGPRDGGGAPPTVDPQPGTAPPLVPEPATWIMTILGFGLVGAAARRRRRRTVPA